MKKFSVIGDFQGPFGKKIPCPKYVSPTLIALFFIYFNAKFTLHDSREMEGRTNSPI